MEEEKLSRVSSSETSDDEETKKAKAKKMRCFRKIFFKISTSNYFSVFIIVIILANTFVLSQDSYPEKKNMSKIYEWANIVFSGIFIIEMFIKLIGLGPLGYLRDRFNIFDAVIVVIATSDIVIFYSFDIKNQFSGAVTAFRAIRLF